MAPILLLSIPVLMLVVLANLGQIHVRARRLSYALLAFVALALLMTGLAAMLAPEDLAAVQPLPGMAGDVGVAGRWLALGGLAALLPVLAAVRAHRRGRDPRLGSLHWSRPVQLTAIVLAVLYTGANLAQATLISDAAALAESGLAIGVDQVAAQTLLLVALAFLGVGVGIRRDWRQALRRLKLEPVGVQQLGPIAAVTMSMVFLSAIIGGLLSLVAPDSLADAEALNRLLIGAFATPAGAVLLGLLTGIGEEVLYRGALQRVFGLWLTSLIFAIHHTQYLSPALLLIFVLGLVLGWVRNRWSTTVAALVHAAYNATLVLLALAAAGMAEV